MADLHGSRYVFDTIRAASHHVDRNAGLHTELSNFWDFDMEAGTVEPFYAGWLRSRARLKEKR